MPRHRIAASLWYLLHSARRHPESAQHIHDLRRNTEQPRIRVEEHTPKRAREEGTERLGFQLGNLGYLYQRPQLEQVLDLQELSKIDDALPLGLKDV